MPGDETHNSSEEVDVESAEAGEWDRIARMMREMPRPVAPDSLYDGLMARISEERVQQDASASFGSTVRRPVRGWLAPVGAAAFGWLVAVSTEASLFERFERVLASALGTASDGVAHVAVQGDRLLYVLKQVGFASSGKALFTGPASLAGLSPVAEQLLLACVWGGIGWGVTVATLAVSRKLFAQT